MTSQRDTFGAKTLTARHFMSDQIYDLETERIFDCHWLCAGRATELAKPGDYLLVQVEGESLIVLCDHHRELRCFYNVCRHRGTRLCERTSGHLGKSICCPYHGWTYDLQGRLVAAPNMRDVQGFDFAEFPLKSAHAAIWEGFVFVNLANHPIALENVFEPISTRFSSWRLSELALVRSQTYTVKANWKLIFQNYNECYHCPRVHPVLNTLTPFKSATNDQQAGMFLGGPMDLGDDVCSMSLGGKACGEVFPDLSTADRRRVYYYSIFPSMFLSPHPDYVLTHRIERVDIGTTRVVCEFLFHPGSMSKPDFDPEPAITFWDEVNRQDWHVCELSQLGIASRAYQPAPYSNLESVVAAFDRCYLEKVEG